MKMREYMQELYRLFSADETLLRLLHYKPVNALDNPLDEDKPNILDMPVSDRYKIIDNIIKFTPTFNGLDTSPICRMFFYPSNRGNTGSYLVADQQFNVDIFTHHEFNDVDLRLSWICDVVNDLLFDKHVTGMGKMGFVRGSGLGSPEGYIAYTLIYEIGSSKR